MPEQHYVLTAEQVRVLREIVSAWQRGELRVQRAAGITLFQQGFKPLIRFTAAAAVTTGTSSFAGNLKEQYGPGISASTDSTVTIRNLITKSSSGYVFSGTSGNSGWAFWDTGRTYSAIQMECT